ncbi:MAG: SRPBCC family protein [Gemmatimonadales bacterium]|nr:SRPBCC family protein [Gemmatimonadales bacterium]
MRGLFLAAGRTVATVPGFDDATQAGETTAEGRTKRERAGGTVLAESSRIVSATVERVFKTLSDGSMYGEMIDNIERVEFVSTARTGVGAKFPETRRFTGLKARLARWFSLESTESECTDFLEHRLVRYVTDEVGAYWHYVYTFRPVSDGSRMHLEMHVEQGRLGRILPAFTSRSVSDGSRTCLEMRVEVRPHGLLGRILPVLIKPIIARGVERDLDRIKAFHEDGAS